MHLNVTSYYNRLQLDIMKTLASLLLGLSLTISSFGAEKKPTTAEHLQNVSVTIRAEAEWSAGEGSGVIFTRKIIFA